MAPNRLVIALAGVNALLAAALAARAGGAPGAADPGIIRARAIELVDQAGQVRAQLTVESNGEAVFRLRDSKGEVRVKLGAGGDGSGLVLLDGTTEPAIHMLAKTGATSLTLTSKGGERRVIVP